jgi:hypothetical protein
MYLRKNRMGIYKQGHSSASPAYIIHESTVPPSLKHINHNRSDKQCRIQDTKKEEINLVVRGAGQIGHADNEIRTVRVNNAYQIIHHFPFF